MSRRSPYSKELLGNVARWYYLNGLSQAEIGNRLDPPKDQTVVARILREAKDRGVIKIDVDQDYAVGGVEDDHLADRLRDEFEINDPIVIDVDSPRAGDQHRDDDLHTAIANDTGVRLRQRIASGDHIAVSGGRAGVRVATVIGRNPPSRKNIVVTPLSGRLWNGRLWEIGPSDRHKAARDSPDRSTAPFEQPLNADYSALILAVGLYNGHAPGIRFSQISHPLYSRSQSEAEAVMRENCAFLPKGKWNWNLSPPNKAFVGVGVVDPNTGHRLIRDLEQRSSRSAPYIGHPPYKELNTAHDLVKSPLPFFGDVANRLFAAVPVPEHLAKASADDLASYTETYRKLTTVLDRINDVSVVMGWDHLRQIDSVLAIGGGIAKVSVLWTLLITGSLHPSLRVIKEVATDSGTAKALLKAKRDHDGSPAAVQKWYREVTSQLFIGSVEKKVRRR